jgi:hypothetical protein
MKTLVNKLKGNINSIIDFAKNVTYQCKKEHIIADLAMFAFVNMIIIVHGFLSVLDKKILKNFTFLFALHLVISYIA